MFNSLSSMKLSSTNDSNREQICLNTLSSSTLSQPNTKSIGEEICTKKDINTQFNKVLIVGLGQLGLPVARYVNERGFDTYGYDISPQAIERAEKTTGVKKAINFGEFDAYILCVSTHKPDDIFSPQIDATLPTAEKLPLEVKNRPP